MKNNILLLIGLGLFSMSCDKFGAYLRKFSKIKQLQVYQIANFPTRGEEQSGKKVYYADYESITAVSLLPEKQKKLKAAILNQSNYSKNQLKKCPFLGKYAIPINKDLVLIISNKPCSKLMIWDNTKNEEVIIDLISANEIESILP